MAGQGQGIEGWQNESVSHQLLASGMNMNVKREERR